MFIGIGLRIGMLGSVSSPANLFASNEQGAWFDPSDLSTLFQDSAGTTPVTTAGQPVGLMLDKSGRGNHATQATSSKRPTYQTAGGLHYLAFDGVDDAMATGTITPGADKAQVFAGVRKLSDASFGIIGEVFSAGSNGIFSIYGKNVPGWEFVSRGTLDAIANINTGYPAPRSDVLTGISNISGPSAVLRVSGAVVEAVTTSQGTGNFLAYPLHIGARGGTSLFFNGNMYGLITRFGANLTDAQIASTEAYIAAKTGVVL